MKTDLSPKTLLTIGDWLTCKHFLTLAISSGWSALYTPQFDDIFDALTRQKVRYIFLLGRCLKHEWECAWSAARAINPDIPIIALTSASEQGMLFSSLLGSPLSDAAQSGQSDDRPNAADLPDNAGVWKRSGLTPTLTLLEPCSDAVSEPIRQCLRYIEANYGEPLTLDDVANRASYSRCHFCKVFKEQVGMSFVTYLNRLRVRSAMNMLAHSPLSITEIAFNVGFNDLSHFERVFRTVYHTSPSRFRQNPQYLP